MRVLTTHPSVRPAPAPRPDGGVGCLGQSSSAPTSPRLRARTCGHAHLRVRRSVRTPRARPLRPPWRQGSPQCPATRLHDTVGWFGLGWVAVQRGTTWLTHGLPSNVRQGRARQGQFAPARPSVLPSLAVVCDDRPPMPRMQPTPLSRPCGMTDRQTDTHISQWGRRCTLADHEHAP
jgi:hypothetical protein